MGQCECSTGLLDGKRRGRLSILAFRPDGSCPAKLEPALEAARGWRRRLGLVWNIGHTTGLHESLEPVVVSWTEHAGKN